MTENPLPTDRNYISNAADATPRRRCNTSRFGRFGPRRFCLLSFQLSAPGPVESLDVPEQFEDAAVSQNDIRVEASHVITSLSYGAQSLLRIFLLPTHSLSFTRPSRSAPQLTIPTRTTTSYILSHVLISLNHCHCDQACLQLARTHCHSPEAFVPSS